MYICTQFPGFFYHIYMLTISKPTPSSKYPLHIIINQLRMPPLLNTGFSPTIFYEIPKKLPLSIWLQTPHNYLPFTLTIFLFHLPCQSSILVSFSTMIYLYLEILLTFLKLLIIIYLESKVSVKYITHH